jgi:hypothetical protein
MCGIDIEHGFLMRRRSVCRIVPLSALQRPDRTSSCASREKNCCGSQRSRSIRVLFLPYPTCDIHPVPLFPSHWRATVWTHWRRCGLLRFLIFHRARRQRAAKPLIHVQSRILDLRQIRSFGLFLPRQERLDQCFILRQRRSALLFASPFYHRTSIDVPSASSRDIFGCSKNRQNRIVENSTYPLDDFGFR